MIQLILTWFNTMISWGKLSLELVNRWLIGIETSTLNLFRNVSKVHNMNELLINLINK